MSYDLKPNNEIIAKYGKNEKDSGRTEAQIAILSNRISYLTEHFKKNPKDHHGRRGLLMLVGKRRRLLKYLTKVNPSRYRSVIADLGLRR